jgi:hypothetical protein
MVPDALFEVPDDDAQPVLQELWKFPGWPVDEAKDRALLADLREQFPALDLIEEIRQWRVWMLDHESKKKVRHRARFRVWCAKAAEFEERRGVGGPRRTSGGSRPVPTAQWGATSDRLERW